MFWAIKGPIRTKASECLYRGYIRIMENKMEATIVYRSYIEIIEMETTIMGYIRVYKNNGKGNGNYYNGLYKRYIGIMENKMETTIVYRGYSI